MIGKSNDDLDLIKKLLSDKLDKKGYKNLYHTDLIRKQMKKQWNENKHNPIDGNIGNRIWSNIQNRGKKLHKTLVPSELSH